VTVEGPVAKLSRLHDMVTPPLPPYPASRPRRLRRDAFSRALVRENHLAPADLIYPVFVLDGQQQAQDVASMPGVQRLSLDRLLPLAEQCLTLGVPVMALFPVIDVAHKTLDGRAAIDPRPTQGCSPRDLDQAGRRMPSFFMRA